MTALQSGTAIPYTTALAQLNAMLSIWAATVSGCKESRIAKENTKIDIGYVIMLFFGPGYFGQNIGIC